MSTNIFYTITDSSFFPGTMALVNSVLKHHPDAEVHVGFLRSEKKRPTEMQVQMLKSIDRVVLHAWEEYAGDMDPIQEPWAAKAALGRRCMEIACDEDSGVDTVVCCDSDLLITGSIYKYLGRAVMTGNVQAAPDGGAHKPKRVVEGSELWPYLDFCDMPSEEIDVEWVYVYSGLIVFPANEDMLYIMQLWEQSMHKDNAHLSKSRGLGDQDRLCCILSVVGMGIDLPDKEDLLIAIAPWKNKSYRIDGDKHTLGKQNVLSVHRSITAKNMWTNGYGEYVKKYQAKGAPMAELFRYFLTLVFNESTGLLSVMPFNQFEARGRLLLPKSQQLHRLYAEYVKGTPPAPIPVEVVSPAKTSKATTVSLSNLTEPSVGEPVYVYLPYRGEFGHKIMWHVPRVHADSHQCKVVCCEEGEEALYPSASEFIICPRHEDKHRRELVRYDKDFRAQVQEQLEEFYKNREPVFLEPSNKYRLERFTPRPTVVQGIKADIVLCPRNRAFGQRKNWGKWDELVKELRMRNVELFAAGAPDSSFKLDVAAAWDYDRYLDATLEAINQARGVVATDAGLAHLAVLCGKAPLLMLCAGTEDKPLTCPSMPGIKMSRYTKANYCNVPIRTLPYWNEPVDAFADRVMKELS